MRVSTLRPYIGDFTVRVRGSLNVPSWGSFLGFSPSLHPDCHFPSGKRSTSSSVPLLSSPLSAPRSASPQQHSNPFPADNQEESRLLFRAVWSPSTLTSQQWKGPSMTNYDNYRKLEVIKNFSPRDWEWSLRVTCLYGPSGHFTEQKRIILHETLGDFLTVFVATKPG